MPAPPFRFFLNIIGIRTACTFLILMGFVTACASGQPSVEKRIKALNKIESEAELVAIAKTEEFKVRLAAIDKIHSLKGLQEVLAQKPDVKLRRAILEKIKDDEFVAEYTSTTRLEAIHVYAAERLTSEAHLQELVLGDVSDRAKTIAIKKISNQGTLIRIASESDSVTAASLAASRITDQSALLKIVLSDQDIAIRVAACQSVTDPKIADEIIRTTEDHWLRRIAATKSRNRRLAPIGQHAFASLMYLMNSPEVQAQLPGLNASLRIRPLRKRYGCGEITAVTERSQVICDGPYVQGERVVFKLTQGEDLLFEGNWTTNFPYSVPVGTKRLYAPEDYLSPTTKILDNIAITDYDFLLRTYLVRAGPFYLRKLLEERYIHDKDIFPMSKYSDVDINVYFHRKNGSKKFLGKTRGITGCQRKIADYARSMNIEPPWPRSCCTIEYGSDCYRKIQ